MTLDKSNTGGRMSFQQRDDASGNDSFTADASLFSALIHSLPLNIYAKDTEGRFIFANRSYCQSVGQTLENILGKTDYEIHPGELAEKYLADDQNIMANRRTESIEEEWQCIGGEKSYVQTIKSPLYDSPDQKRVIGTIGMFRDMKERNKAQNALAEERSLLRTVIDIIPSYIYVKDAESRFIIANKSVTDAMGARRPDDLLGKTDFDFYPHEQAERFMEIERRVIASEKPVADHEESFIDARGSVRHVLTTKTPLRNIDDRVIGLVGIAHDITERKQVEREQLKLEKMESLGVLAGGIAHDFNNLLTGLFGNIEMAKRSADAGEESRAFLESAVRSMENATNLTNQLLTFARGGDPIKETLSIGAVITETARFSLRGSNIRLQSDIAPDLWPVSADKGQLSHVISNLVINAQQAMPDGGVISVAARNMGSRDGGSVRITVRDEGAGIPPNDLDRIFDPYFTTKKTGNGLGLASTLSIIHQHNGDITVDSKPNQGATFTILLPAAEETGPWTVENALEEPESADVSSTRILVLDDEAFIREVIGAMLKKMGCEVSFAAEGEGAVRSYREALRDGAAYDVVIVDLTIPGGMGGKEAAREILRIDPDAKIMISSGYATDPVMTNYEKHGFKGVVIKPYRFKSLKTEMQRVLGMDGEEEGPISASS